MKKKKKKKNDFSWGWKSEALLGSSDVDFDQLGGDEKQEALRHGTIYTPDEYHKKKYDLN